MKQTPYFKEKSEEFTDGYTLSFFFFFFFNKKETWGKGNCFSSLSFKVIKVSTHRTELTVMNEDLQQHILEIIKKMPYFNQRTNEHSNPQSIRPNDDFAQTMPHVYFPQAMRNRMLEDIMSNILPS